MRLMLGEIAAMVDGALHGNDVRVSGAGIDSRALNAGDLFCALPGERTDGHRFVSDAARAGAAGALTTRLVRVEPALPQVVVDDVGAALGALAHAWRGRQTLCVVALTGSNGKTTTKEMIASILRVGHTVVATEGNMNNELGVPLTLLRMDEGDEYAVVEMGASRKGDIRFLCGLAEPGVGLVLNAGQAHLKGFGDPEQVALAKGELFECLPPDGVGVLNADSPHYARWKAMLKARPALSFGVDADADVRVTQTGDKARLEIRGEACSFTPGLPGAHNLSNAAAAAAVATALGVDAEAVVRGLESASPMPGRLCRLRGVSGSLLIDDSYNANPTSLSAALPVLAGMSDEPWLALGDMDELGDAAVALHEDAGREARRMGVRRLFTVGDFARCAGESFGEGARHFASVSAAAEYLGGALRPGVGLLVKGSRAAGMDALVRALRADKRGGRLC